MIELVLMPLIGIVVTCIGYGLLSRKKNPTAGVGYTTLGFLFRVAGPLLIRLAALFWMENRTPYPADSA
ncbi:MAG: hypothetical protein ABSG53_15940 [Thermoguttaceae bacterium]